MLAKKRELTVYDYVAKLDYVEHLPEAGTLTQRVATARGKLDRIAELKRQLSSLEADAIGIVDEVNGIAEKHWTTKEIRAAKEAAQRGRAR